MERTDILFYKEIEQKFIAFAETRNDIRAAFVIGSRARIDHPADQWSDMDIVFYTTNSNYYLQQQEWLKKIGDVVCSFVFQTTGADPERLNLFSDGRQVDFVIHSIETLRNIVAANTVPNNFHRGVRVIVDKDNISKNIMPAHFGPPEALPLSEAAYLQVVNMFWSVSLYISKQLLRGELWTAKMRDNDLKGLLLQMIEWYEKAVFGTGYDTWHAGRFMSEWVDKNTLEALSESFGRFDQVDSWCALQSTTNLFLKLSKEVALKMQYDYPVTLETYVSDWIKTKAKSVEQ